MFKRSERLKGLFLKEINAALRDMQDPALSAFLTLTDLDLSPDGKNARVFYSLLGTEEDRAAAQRALERCTPLIRQALFRRLRLKFIPKLAFAFDETPERADRIETLIDQLSAERRGESAPRMDRERLKSLASRRRRRRR